MSELRGRVALITGASRGIGRAIALRLGRAGADIAVNYLSHDRAALELVDQIQALGVRAVAVRGDLAVPSEVDGMVAETADRLGGPTILVNNAAIFPWYPWDQVPLEEWDRVFAVNARGPWLACRAVAPYMRDSSWGRIISMASATFLTGSPFLAHYAASKGAVIGLTRSLARALGDDGITVNAVSTGKTLTEGFEQYFEQGVLDREATLKSREEQAIKRIGSPEDVVGAVAFLASDEASYLTGQILNVDGGRSMY
jgi:NAD(P)-dependent dehydrogenase (short-subunit alcohol dehydrogenase family)